MRIPILAALAVALALSAVFLSPPTAHAGCDDGNSPDKDDIERGIYWCSYPQGLDDQELFPAGHIYAEHWPAYLACLEHLEELDLRPSPAWWGAAGASQTNDPDLLGTSTFCRDGVFVNSLGVRDCADWTHHGVNPAANLDHCAEWAAVAFSPYSTQVDLGGGVVCVPVYGCARTNGAQADNPAIQRAVEEADFVEAAPLAPPSAGDGGLLQEATVPVAAVLLLAFGLIGAAVMTGLYMGSRR